MGHTMKKSEVLYGGGSAKVAVHRVDWDAIEEMIEQHLGPDARIRNLGDAKKAVGSAKGAKKAGKTYVKVGLVKNDLVLRIKTPGLLVDDEKDTVVVPNARRAMARFAAEKEQKKKARDAEDEEERNLPVEAKAARHLALRQQMVGAQEEFLATVVKARRDIEGHAEMAERFREKAVKGANGLHGRLADAAGAIRAVDEAETVLQGLQKAYKAFTRSGGPLMKARGDFHKIGELPKDDQQAYREASNAAFREGDVFMKQANALIDDIKDEIRKLRTLRDEASAAAGQGTEASEVLARLDEIRNDLEKLESGIDRRHGKSEAYADETMSPWPLIFQGTAPAEMLTKAFTQKKKECDAFFAALPAGERRLQQVERQIRALPRGATDHREVAKEVAELEAALQGARTKLQEIVDREQAYRGLVVRAEEALAAM